MAPLHGRKGLRRALFIVAAVCGVITMVVGVRGLDGLFFGLGAAALLVAVVLREPETTCSFCGKSRAQVKKLVASTAVSICDECLPLSMAVVLEEQPTHWALLINSLPPHTPRAISSGLISVTAATFPADQLDTFLRTCFRLGNPDAARALLETVPEGERSGAQWINLGVCLGQLGRYAEAIAATRRAVDSEAWVLNNAAAFTLDAEPARRDVQALLDDVTRARTLLDTVPEAMRPELRGATLGTLAELHRRRGALDDALASLVEADGGLVTDGWRGLTRARVLLDQGKTPEAHAVLVEVAKGHPEALVTLEAKRLMQQPTNSNSLSPGGGEGRGEG